MSDSLRPHELQHARPPCPSPTPRVHSDLCPWALESIITNKASRGDGIPVELFQILKEDAVSVALNMPANLENLVATGLKKSVFIPIPKKGNAKECSNYHTTALISHASKVTLKILQARFQ